MISFCKKHISYFRQSHSRAFTLVEMIVSLGIFAVVAVVALGALARIITANQKAQTLEAAMTNLNFGLDAMSRELRVGTDYECLSDVSPNTVITPGTDVNGYGNLTLKGCSIDDSQRATINSGNATIIAFRSSQRNKYNTCNLIYAYRFINEPNSDGTPNIHLQKAEQSKNDQLCTDPIPSINFGIQYQDLLSSDNINLTDYRLGMNNVVPATSPMPPYPLIFVRLNGYAGVAGVEKSKTYFDIQGAISSRAVQQ